MGAATSAPRTHHVMPLIYGVPDLPAAERRAIQRLTESKAQRWLDRFRGDDHGILHAARGLDQRSRRLETRAIVLLARIRAATLDADLPAETRRAVLLHDGPTVARLCARAEAYQGVAARLVTALEQADALLGHVARSVRSGGDRGIS
jgi:hypothetical protein